MERDTVLLANCMLVCDRQPQVHRSAAGAAGGRGDRRSTPDLAGVMGIPSPFAESVIKERSTGCDRTEKIPLNKIIHADAIKYTLTAFLTDSW
jgi:hypothetical protein